MRRRKGRGAPKTLPTAGLDLSDPQTVQVAVLVNFDRTIALGDSKVGFRLVGARQLCNLVPPVSYTHLTLPTTERV